jgi:hypothetical protein
MYSRLISVLFFMFFTCVVLNPQMNNMTIYFYVFIPFFDPKFTAFLWRHVRSWFTPALLAVAAAAVTSPSAAVRVVSIGICVGYLVYTWERRISYLHHWMIFNILFATLQFVMYYVNRDFAFQIGPTNVSELIWGEFATPTNTNFYEVFLFTRVAGLSREAGFFSSLLVGSLIFHLVSEKPNRKLIALYAFGLFLSFSKSSMVLFLFAGLYPFRHSLRKTHPVVVMVVFYLVVTVISVYLASQNFYGSDTFGHRLAGYAFVFDAQLEDVIKGITAENMITHYKYLPYIHLILGDMASGVAFGGLPATIAEVGLFSALVIFAVIAFTAADGFVMTMFLFLSATVSVTTVTSFIPLAYVICYWPRYAAYRARYVAPASPPPPRPRTVPRYQQPQHFGRSPGA